MMEVIFNLWEKFLLSLIKKMGDLWIKEIARQDGATGLDIGRIWGFC